MGVIKSGLLVIACFLLLIVFLAGNLFLTVNLSLNHDNVKTGLNSVIKELIKENEVLDMENSIEVMQLYCQNNQEYVFSQEGKTFVIPCDVVSQGSESVFDNVINGLVDEYYYKTYECGFFDCFESGEPPFFLVSEQTKNTMKVWFYYCLIIAILLVALMFFLIENKINLFILTGVIVIVSSLPFLKLESFISFFSSNLFGVLSLFFSKSYNVFIIFFIIGLILLILGIMMRFFHFGLKLSDLFNKIFNRGESSSGNVEVISKPVQKPAKQNSKALKKK